jgi:cytoskeletal protein CcmA (bactofilin family)
MCALRALALLVLLMAIVPLGGCDDGIVRGAVVFDGEQVLGRSETLEGDLVVLAGRAEIDEGAVVRGSVWVLGGACVVSGVVEGDVTGLAGRLTLGDSSRVGGDLVLGGSDAEVAEGAQVEGETTETLSQVSGDAASAGPRLRTGLQAALLLGVLALLVSVWWGVPLARVGAAAVRYPVASLATGVMAGVTGLIVVVLVGFTLVLLPVAVLMGLGGLVAVALGWAGLAAHVAARVAATRLPRALATGLLAAAVLVVVTLLALVPVAGGTIALLAAAWGLGAALLTRVGSREFRPAVIADVQQAEPGDERQPGGAPPAGDA